MPRHDVHRPLDAPLPAARQTWHQVAVFVLLALLWFPWSARAAAPPQIHVLVDTSGSMQETDPDNLRAPALGLLADLVAERSRVRVDRFGRDVTTLLPSSATDAPTRAAMRRSAGQLGADSPLTDIPAALLAANSGWQRGGERHVILLSDGKVDVEGDVMADREATVRLRREVIPRLADNDVRVHTVALSDKADTDLLADIADRTGGLTISVRSSAELQRAFLALFEATAPRTGLPLVDNRVQVDESVLELTLVIFRETTAGTEIRLPDGRQITAARARDLTNWRWDAQAGRDLITVELPPTGEWEVLAPTDPDNRALVITDLGLTMSDLPGRLHRGEVAEGHLLLTDRGLPILEPGLSRDASATLTVLGPDRDVIERRVLRDDGREDDRSKEDGRFDFRLSLPGRPGIHTLIGRLESPTFKRVIRRKVALSPTPVFRLRVDPESSLPADPLHSLLIEQDDTVVDPGATRMQAELRCPGATPNRTEAMLDRPRHRILLPARLSPDCRVIGELQSRSRNGNDIRRAFDLEVPPIPVPPKFVPSPQAAEPPPDPAAKPVVDPPEPASAPIRYREAFGFGLIGIGLLLLLVLVARRRERQLRRQLIEQTPY